MKRSIAICLMVAVAAAWAEDEKPDKAEEAGPLKIEVKSLEAQPVGQIRFTCTTQEI